MGAKLIKVYIVILIVAIVVGVVALYYAFNSAITPQAQRQAEQQEDSGPAIGIYAKSKRYVTLAWRRLFGGAETIVVYRLSPENPKWVEWKRVALENKDKKGGFIDLLLGTSGGSTDYTYYFQILNTSGTIIYTSGTSTTQTAPTSTPPSTPPSSSTSTPSTTPTSTPPTSTTPTSTASSSPPIHSTTSTTTSTPPAIYYTPDGQPIVGVSTAYPTDPFWVVYADAGIEIGWQNMPATAVRVVVSRSQAQSSGYEQLFARDYAYGSGVNFLRVVDDSFSRSWYYKLEAQNTSGATIATYGPLYLPAK